MAIEIVLVIATIRTVGTAETQRRREGRRRNRTVVAYGLCTVYKSYQRTGVLFSLECVFAQP